MRKAVNHTIVVTLGWNNARGGSAIVVFKSYIQIIVLSAFKRPKLIQETTFQGARNKYARRLCLFFDLSGTA
jgi:hypothetical protein